MKLQFFAALLAAASTCVVLAKDYPTADELVTDFQAKTNVDAPIPGSLFASADLSTAFVWDPTQEEEYHRIVVRQYRSSRRTAYTRKGVRFTLTPSGIDEESEGDAEVIQLAFAMDKNLLAVQQECSSSKKKNCITNEEYIHTLTQDTPAEKATTVFTPAGYEVSVIAAVEERFNRRSRLHGKHRVHTYILWVKIPKTLAEGSYKMAFDLVRKRHISNKFHVYAHGGFVNVMVQAATGTDDDTVFKSVIRGDTTKTKNYNNNNYEDGEIFDHGQSSDGRGLGYHLGAPVRLAAGGVRNVAGTANKVFCFVTRTGQKKCIDGDEIEE